MERVIHILQAIRPEENFSESNNFIEEGLLDSFDLISLVTDLDTTYSISIDGIDIVPENFKSLSSIKELLKKNGIN
jgi:acyl carrier protein